MTSAVVAIALSLPTMLYLMVENIKQLETGFESPAQITVYVDRRASQRAISILQDQLQALPDIADVKFISAEQALREFQASSGFGSALQTFGRQSIARSISCGAKNGCRNHA